MKTIEHWFPTFTGKVVDLENPTPDMVDIEDIAHALSMTCRFGGHCRDFYSVAEHSTNVLSLGHIKPHRYKGRCGHSLAFLLHDAAEAYLGDVVSPLKKILYPQYAPLETKWLAAIESKFDIPHLLTCPDTTVKECDILALSVEIECLYSPAHPDWWTKFKKPTTSELSSIAIECLSPAQARRKFLAAFRQLQRGSGS